MDQLNEQSKYVNSLDDISKKMLQWYTTREYRSFNENLRQGQLLSSLQLSMLSHIDNTFSQTPSLKEIFQVYRGIDSEFINVVLTYISTTCDISVAESFAGEECSLLRITVLPGAKILPLKNISLAGYEEEILLSRDGYFINNFIDTSRKPILYDLTYVPACSFPLLERPVTEISAGSSPLLKRPVTEIVYSRPKSISSEELVERIVNLANPDEIELLGPRETVLSLVKHLGIDVPSEIIASAIHRISI
jgi:hypothetical protein